MLPSQNGVHNVSQRKRPARCNEGRDPGRVRSIALLIYHSATLLQTLARTQYDLLASGLPPFARNAPNLRKCTTHNIAPLFPGMVAHGGDGWLDGMSGMRHVGDRQ